MSSATMNGSHRSIKPGSSIIESVDLSPANQCMKKPRKTNIQVKVALIGAVSVVVAAIITAILGPVLLNQIATPIPVHVVGQYNGMINNSPPTTGENTSNNRNNVHGNNNSTHILGNGNNTGVLGNGNSTHVLGNDNSTHVQGNDNSINIGP